MLPSVLIGSDHAGYTAKNAIFNLLHNLGYHVEDIGCYNESPVDYPDISKLMCSRIEVTHFIGILLCGTGQGMAMSANRQSHIRAGVAWNENIAELLKLHNNANVLCLPAKFMEIDEMKKVVLKFLTTNFSKEERHVNRLASF